MQNKNIILGIDPGYGRVGIAVIEKYGKAPTSLKLRGAREKLIHSECFETDSKLPHLKRLLLIGEKIKEIIQKYEPKKIAVETLLWSKNKKTALQVAEARGVILLEAARFQRMTLEESAPKGNPQEILVCEYNPNQIKLAVTGYGKSDKKQVINMIEKLLKLNPPAGGKERYDDEYDAIATALTCSAISLPPHSF